MYTPKGQEPQALQTIQRFEVVDCIDSKHVPAVIPNAFGPWVRYEDHAAQVEALSAAQAVPTAITPDGEPSNVELRGLWYGAGGTFHGPNVETGTMPEAKLLPFLRSLIAAQAGVPTSAASERELFKEQFRHLELEEVPDAWGRPVFKHSHVGAIWKGWRQRAAVAMLTVAPVQPAPQPAPSPAPAFQQRVHPWLLECFGVEIAADRTERNHRFLEESLELVQALGCTASEAHQLVDYVFGRPVGDPPQEVGGVMVTLAALCLASGLDMHDAGEVELARISAPELVTKIRAKQAAKPKHSPLPEVSPAPAQPGQEVEREMFEAEFPVPGGVRWDGAEYVVSDSYVNSYRCDRFIGQWAAWQARAARAAPQPAPDVPSDAEWIAERHVAIKRFHTHEFTDGVTTLHPDCITNALREGLARGRAAPQPATDCDHGPQATTIEEAARDVGKWLNERPNRPIDLRHVAMLAHYAQTPQPAVREPREMTQLEYARLQEISLDYSDSEDECTGFRDGWRSAEKHYGITKGGQ